MNKPAIVLIAFGTSVAEARKVFDYIDEQARKRYPDYTVRWAFTSQFIINKLKKQGQVTHNVAETIAQLRAEGVEKIVFQSLHVVPGQEYRKVLAADTAGLEVAFGDALLTSDEDIRQTIDALQPHIDADEPTVFVAHGNDNYPEYNDQIVAFAEKVEAAYPHSVVASVEGSPGVEPLQKVKQMDPQQVNFVPLMIVSGDHMINDVAGDEEDSWKNTVGAPNYRMTSSLGWNNSILDIYFNHLDAALQQVG